ncbi:hypothetical protein [Ornithinimicrobium kibberense]|uniref:hypothetical protein n=1 Tax=Ornithinimicrobium kibberense TaxID=282060 RepID=UPI00361C773F
MREHDDVGPAALDGQVAAVAADDEEVQGVAGLVRPGRDAGLDLDAGDVDLLAVVADDGGDLVVHLGDLRVVLGVDPALPVGVARLGRLLAAVALLVGPVLPGALAAGDVGGEGDGGPVLGDQVVVLDVARDRALQPERVPAQHEHPQQRHEPHDRGQRPQGTAATATTGRCGVAPVTGGAVGEPHGGQCRTRD